MHHVSRRPLHLVDFGLHMWHNAHDAQALVFYVPKLENEEEAGYLRYMISCAGPPTRPNPRLGLQRALS